MFRSWDANGAPLVGGLLNTYAAGTTTPIQTFTDATAATPNANPVVLNARGEASVWILPNMGYKFVLTDQYGTLIWTEDHVFLSQLLTLTAEWIWGRQQLHPELHGQLHGAHGWDRPLLDSVKFSDRSEHAERERPRCRSAHQPERDCARGEPVLANQVATIMYKGGNWLLIQGAAQGIVAYGGTDTGAANAYVLPMTNQYFSYTAGNVVYFIPSNSVRRQHDQHQGSRRHEHRRHGVNPGAIQAGVMAQLVYNGSTFTLINTTVISSSGSFTATAATGMTTTPAITIYYSIVGSVITWMWGGGLQGPATAPDSRLPGCRGSFRTSLEE